MSAEYNARAIDTAKKVAAARETRATTTGQAATNLFPDYNRIPYGVAREYERMGQQPVSAGLLERTKARGLTLEHLATTLGTVIHGIDLRKSLDASLIQCLRDLLLERKVIFFRDQPLTEDEHASFARHFGDLDAFPFGRAGENPYCLHITHDEKRPGTENSWHTDVTWMAAPSLGSVAQCIEVPPVGGDTLFSDSHASFLGLRPALQEQICHLDGINDYRIFIHALPAALVEDIKAAIPFGVSHPLARTHPETGKTALYIHGQFLRHSSLTDRRTGEQLDEASARALVAELLTQHGRPEYTCRFRWEKDSLAFWDNRAVQHYATSDYWPHRRVLRRITVSGDKPYYDPTADTWR